MESGIEFVKWFSELNKDNKDIAGGKGANLAEIFNLGINVPQGFVVTAQAYKYFIEKAGLKEKIDELLKRIDYEDTKKLNEITKQIRVFIMDSNFPEEMENDILESYSHLDVGGFNSESRSVLDILKNSSEPVFVAVRSSATAEDLADASFAGQQDSFVNVKGEINLIKHIKKCFASLFTSRATYYRNKKGFEHSKTNIAVVVQRMVDSDKSGVIFSKDPSYNNDNVIMEAVWGLGEGIVSGRITPDKYVVSKDLEISDKKVSDKKVAITRDAGGGKKLVELNDVRSKQQVLKDYEIQRLAEISLKLEDHYEKPQDIEFAIEGEEIFIVQTRPITTMAKRMDSGGIKSLEGEIILSGLAASPGIAFGKVKIIEDLDDLHKIREGNVLVTKMTNPDMVVSMQKSSAIITDEGGLTAHAAIVSREMGIPAIVGTREATSTLKDGDIVTVDGFSGNVYRGKVSDSVKKEVEEVDIKTKTDLKVIVDLPSFAGRAAKTGLKKVGLSRMEGIIAEGGKHPKYFLDNDKLKDYEDIIYNGIKGISKYFEEVWVRTSDIRSDEYRNLEGAPQELEANPMLGMHGIRFGLKNLGILKAELNALKRVSDEGKGIGVMFPQVILLEELKKCKKILNEIGFKGKIGVMIETPGAVQLIRDFCEEGIDFISFGTNDLTQYILAVDRGNEEVQDLYNEMHPAVLYQIAYVIRVCKRYGVETSICGQAGSKKEMVKHLIDYGINSITLNADVAKDISEYVAELEGIKIQKTDEAPRQYEVKKEIENIQKKNVNEKEGLPEIPGANSAESKEDKEVFVEDEVEENDKNINEDIEEDEEDLENSEEDNFEESSESEMENDSENEKLDVY